REGEEREPEHRAGEDQRRAEMDVPPARDRPIEARQPGGRVRFGSRTDDSPATSPKGDGGGSDVGDRDEASDPGRAGRQDAAVAAADDRDRIAARVRTPAR